MTVLGIAGSLRSGSLNRELLRVAAREAPEGVELETWDGLRDIPPYDTDVEDEPTEAVEDFRAAVRNADAVLIATPEYNGSIPGVLKNALDWASRPDVSTNPFRGKPVAVVGASTGMFGAAQAVADTERILARMGARVVKCGIAVPKAHECIDDPDPELCDRLSTTLGLLAAEAETSAAIAQAA